MPIIASRAGGSAGGFGGVGGFALVVNPLNAVDYLVIAGGGGGGVNRGGGGGAGGLRSTVTATGGGGTLESTLSLSVDTAYTVTVLCVKEVVPDALNPQDEPSWKIASVSIMLMVSADLTPTITFP